MNTNTKTIEELINEVSTGTAGQIVEIWNGAIEELGDKAEFSGKTLSPVSKFADKATAIKRTTNLIKKVLAPFREENGATVKPTKKAKAKASNEEVAATDPDASHASRSAGISRSWEDPTIAAKRAERHGVELSVDGGAAQYFGSVRKAYLALGLPLSQHIAFRMHLKEQGKVKENGRSWKVVPLQKVEKKAAAPKAKKAAAKKAPAKKKAASKKK